MAECSGGEQRKRLRRGADGELVRPLWAKGLAEDKSGMTGEPRCTLFGLENGQEDLKLPQRLAGGVLRVYLLPSAHTKRRGLSLIAMSTHESIDSGILPGAVFKIYEAAEILKVHPRTVKRMVKDGRLRIVGNLGAAVRIPRAEIVRTINSPRTLNLLQRMDGRKLGFDSVDTIYGDIPEPHPRELLGFLLQKRREDLVLTHARFLPLGKWLSKQGPKSDEDAVSWCYLRSVARKISELRRPQRQALRQRGRDAFLVIELLSPQRPADVPPADDVVPTGFTFDL